MRTCSPFFGVMQISARGAPWTPGRTSTGLRTVTGARGETGLPVLPSPVA